MNSATVNTKALNRILSVCERTTKTNSPRLSLDLIPFDELETIAAENGIPLPDEDDYFTHSAYRAALCQRLADELGHESESSSQRITAAILAYVKTHGEVYSLGSPCSSAKSLVDLRCDLGHPEFNSSNPFANPVHKVLRDQIKGGFLKSRECGRGHIVTLP